MKTPAKIYLACAAVLALSNSASAEGADTSATASEMGPVIALVNHLAAGATAKTAPEWIEIPLGNHDHAQAMQVLDAESGALLVSNFNSQKEAKGAKFKGLPVYFGHPDDPALANIYRDKRARGWIREMEVSNEALRLKVDWTPLGRREVEDEEVAFVSPRWGVVKLANSTRNVRPVSLISVGLVNEPNIRDVAPLINEVDASAAASGAMLPPWIHVLAGTKEGDSEETVKAALQKKVEDAGKIEEVRAARDNFKAAAERHEQAHKDLQASISNAATESSQALALANEATATEKTRAETAEAALTIANAAVASERTARVELIVEKLITGGRITLAEKEGVITQLSNAAESFEALVTTLSNKAPVIHTGAALTKDLGKRRGKVDAAQEGESTRQSTVLSLVNTRMTETGEDYSTAFNNVRKGNPVLFDEMKKPPKASSR